MKTKKTEQYSRLSRALTLFFLLLSIAWLIPIFEVVIPNVMPAITTCTFLTLTNSFKMFDQNMALTGGLPSVMQNGAKVNVTELLALNIYSTYNINKNWHGVAQAKAVVFFILVAVLAIAQQAATRSKEVQ